MYTKKNFIKRNKYKFIAFCIFSFFSFLLAYCINHIGYKNLPNLPGDLKIIAINHFYSLFSEEEPPIDYKRIQYINDSIEAERSKSHRVYTISGNFDGTGFTDYAFISPNSGYIEFSKGKAFAVVDLIELNPKDDKLFQEGDLDNDGADDFSVYRYKKGLRNEIITYLYADNEPWTRCLTIYLNSDEKATDEDIKARVFRKNNQIYYLDEVKDEKTNKYKLITKSLKNFKAK